MLRNAYLLCVFSKSPYRGRGVSPLPHPPPARSLRSLAHIFQAPSSPPKFTLEPRLVGFILDIRLISSLGLGWDEIRLGHLCALAQCTRYLLATCSRHCLYSPPLCFGIFCRLICIETYFPGGGGGHSPLKWEGGCRWGALTSQVGRGCCAGGGGGSKPDPVSNRSADRKYTLSQYTLLKTFIYIPCCNISHLGYTLSYCCFTEK